jgi:hypothetical protein
VTEPDDQGDEPDLEPLYSDVQSWVEHVYVVTFIRPETQSLRWCASWWAHPEAIIRFTALWLTWEMARLVPGTGMADWLRTNLDTLTPVLHSAAGPFASCKLGVHRDQEPMPITRPPLGYWEQTIVE